jgi:hypothetical protein
MTNMKTQFLGMRDIPRFIKTIAAVLAVSLSAFPQVGSLALSHSVIASGGGTNSAGGVFVVDGTIGQNIAGTLSTGGTIGLRSGFWGPDALIPTAAPVAISGLIRNSGGNPISNVRVTLTDRFGGIRAVRSSPFGYYRFEDVPAGETYIITVSGGRYAFANPIRVVFVIDDLADIDFVADPQ